MIDRRRFAALCAAAVLAAAGHAVATGPALAAEPAPFSAQAFEAARSAGKSILVEVSAPWCPTCRAQKPILSDLRAEARFKNLVVFNVDFDSQKDALRKFNAQRQSTLIVFKGGAEVGRSVGDTKKASIEALLARAI